jgi:hypothetical protein
VLEAAEELDDDGLAELLRQEELTVADLEAWRSAGDGVSA